MNRKIAIAILSISLFAACVPAKKVEDIKRKKAICEEQRAALEEANRKLDEDFTEVNEKYKDLMKSQKGLMTDTTIQGRSLRLITRNYDQLNDTYQLLLDKNKELLEGSEAESAKMFSNLTNSQSKLRARTAALDQAKLNLEAKEKNLAQLKTALEKREERVNELEAILARKDSAVNALKSKVQKALLGFENNGLTIEQKNGKVYVSLDESLLFASGSYNIEKKGKEALNSLGEVLEKNVDVNVLVEGHTDNVPFKGSGVIKDNWDLSVKRATSVVKIILD
ncbi:MAG: OmpA family protein, partial [Flavobacteriales bacterium]|nr:OmpA family protein [Flavobacteriales bacterium]